MYNNKTIKALICVRSGSVRVPNKNIRPFAGLNLLEIKIQQLKRIKELDGICVNSNSNEMLTIAKSYGIETVKRDEYFATSEVPANEMLRNAAENIDCDVVLSTTVTTPLVNDETFSKAINMYWNIPKEYDSLMTVLPLKEFLWVDGKAFNYKVEAKPRSQDLPDNCVILNHCINIYLVL